MKKIALSLIYTLCVFYILLFSHCKKTSNNKNVVVPIEVETFTEEAEDEISCLYKECGLKGLLDFSVFRHAMAGFKVINPKKDNLITIIDYSLPSTKERFFVIDLLEKNVLFQSLVAHGRNTGANIAKRFSNIPESKQSSLGFFLTAETYMGKHGYSLRLDGLERGINHNARRRAIVMHAASYVSKAFVRKEGRLGRSWGCPALPKHLSKEVINTIKNGSCMFLYAEDRKFKKQSKFLHKPQPECPEEQLGMFMSTPF